MSLFKRIGDNVRANLNAAIDKAEDPVKMLNQYLLDMEDDILDAENAMARQLVVVRKFKTQYEDAASQAQKRDVQALEALKKDREDLARRALEDKKLQLARRDEYLAQYEKSRETADKLRTQLREMKDEHENFRARRDTLVARAEAARAQKEIAGFSGYGKDNGRRGFERMEAKVMQMEAQAEVACEIKSTEKSLDDELAALSSDEGISDELKKLKEQLQNDSAS